MTFEIGLLTLQPATPVPGAPVRAPSEPPAPAATALDAVDVIPVSPPRELLAEVDAAWECAAELAADNRELHFRSDEQTGRTIIEVRTLDGEVLRTIPPSRMLDVIGGGAL
jgi:flagellar protein FlaG